MTSKINKSTLLFLILLIALSIYWYRGFAAIQKVQKISFFEYITTDTKARIRQVKTAFDNITGDINNSINNDDQVKINSLKKIAETLEIYKADNEHYPEKLSEIKYLYIDQTGIFNDKTLLYSTKDKNLHYELSVGLKNNQTYRLSK